MREMRRMFLSRQVIQANPRQDFVCAGGAEIGTSSTSSSPGAGVETTTYATVTGGGGRRGRPAGQEVRGSGSGGSGGQGVRGSGGQVVQDPPTPAPSFLEPRLARARQGVKARGGE